MFNVKSLLVVALAGFSALAAAHPDNKNGKYGKDHKDKHDDDDKHKSRGPRNFIMVVPDGFGPASETMARDYMHWKDNSTAVLPIDEMVIGLVRTKATDSYVTDSAASATAYSCGIKSYNGAIGVDDDYEPCGTVLEAAHLEGFKTGLVVTSRITHATPATFASHIYHRDLESEIALQEIGYAHPLGRTVDVMLGGGRCFFTPNTTEGSCREDGIDALAIARDLGYTTFQDRATFDSELKLPYLGLFTNDHMSYEADRDPAVEPSLKEMAIKGLNDLYRATKDSEKGFFIMVEASRIDHAGHANDPVGHLHDILAYNEAMLAMREWIDEHSDSPTTLISTADHECGGLTVGKEISGPPGYWYDPSFFAGAKATSGPLSKQWAAYTGSDQKGYLKSEIFAKYGIAQPTEQELSEGIALKSSASKFAKFLTKALSSRLGVNWATGGHTASDVTLFGWGVNSKTFAGSRENNEVGHFIANQLGLDLESVTKKLQSNETWQAEWVKPKPGHQRSARDLHSHHH
ncbi:alkaline-phosphatase-like protein [Pyronema omphalodes]|nr:alkaline-phosphatase-like protein [Pyronema omphalodes]